MARLKLSAEQKAMLLALSPKEKDKLLLRLIAKEPLLVEQLSFLHIEGGKTTDERAAEFRASYENYLDPGGVGELSPGVLMMQLRYASGKLSRHVQVTKDKLGEVQLAVEMLHFALDIHLQKMRIRYRQAVRWEKFAPYLAKRTKSVLAKADKLHPDLWLEFERQLNELLQMIYETPELRNAAEREELPKHWEGPID